MRMIAGKIVAEKCECCGHHEIGIVDSDSGEYEQLKPGMNVIIHVRSEDDEK